MNSVVLVRKGAPNDLLIGTDVQPKLGFTLVAENDDGGMTDLFNGQPVNMGWLLGNQDANLTPPGSSEKAEENSVLGSDVFSARYSRGGDLMIGTWC